MAALETFAAFPGAELEYVFNGDTTALVVLQGSLRLEIVEDRCARDGFHVEAAYIVAPDDDSNAEIIGLDHRLSHAVRKFYRLKSTIAECQDRLEYERAGRKDAA